MSLKLALASAILRVSYCRPGLILFGTMKEGLFPDILRGPAKYFVGGSRATFFFEDFFFDFIGFFFRKVDRNWWVHVHIHQISYECASRDSKLHIWPQIKSFQPKFTRFLAFFEITPTSSWKPQNDQINIISLYNLSWKYSNRLPGYKFELKPLLNLEYLI